MCVDHSITCSCGRNTASFNFRDDLLPAGAVTGLYCPDCSPSVGFDHVSMLRDNGWIIAYEMDIARFALRSVTDEANVGPEFIFDEGYASWRGVYPGDHIDSARERAELTRLAKTDPKRYFEQLRSWGNTRMERLAREGWRKARETESVQP